MQEVESEIGSQQLATFAARLRHLVEQRTELTLCPSVFCPNLSALPFVARLAGVMCGELWPPEALGSLATRWRKRPGELRLGCPLALGFALG